MEPGRIHHPPHDRPGGREEHGSRKTRRMGLPLALGLCIGVAVILTGINMVLYLRSNLSRIDLSKPKYADIRKDLRPSQAEGGQEQIDTTSPITAEAIREQIDELRVRQEELRRIGGFDSPVLDDSAIGIGGADEGALLQQNQ
ncbi:hypothetical protein JNJ66_07740 [Candidatus Saccharibacteria bacterium]|nr:hypothetical protein [Candidatus Saccharibacteria bacterium]